VKRGKSGYLNNQLAKRLFVFIFFLFSIIIFSFQAKELTPSFPLFRSLYQWEPLKESEGFNRVIAKASIYPTTGPFQDGNIMAFSVRERTLVVVNLDNGKVILEKVYPEKCIVHAVRNGYIFYYVGQPNQTLVLSVAKNQEIYYPGRLALVTEKGFLVTEERGTLHVYDLNTKDCLFSQPGQTSSHPVLALGDLILLPTRDSRHNFAGYIAFSSEKGKSSRFNYLDQDNLHFPEYSGHSWPERFRFPRGPLPILHQEGKDTFLELIDLEGQVLWRKSLASFNVEVASRLSPSPLSVFDYTGEKILIAVEGIMSADKVRGSFHFFIIDYKGKCIRLGAFSAHLANKIFGAFIEDGSVAIIEGSAPDTVIFHVFSADGRLLHEGNLWPNLSSPWWSRVVEGKELLLFRSQIFLRYSLPRGELIGVYPFPEGFDPYLDKSISVIVHKGKAFPFLANQLGKSGGIEKPSLVSFSLFEESWPLPVELVSVSPHGGTLYEVFEDRPTELRFRTLSSLESALQVAVGEGSITRMAKETTFQWQTPALSQGKPKKVDLVASLGPARRVFPMTVVPLANPLILEVEEWYEGQYLVVSWTLRNSSPANISNLSFNFETTNLEFSHGNPSPESLKIIKEGETLYGKLYFKRLFEGMKVTPHWNGYNVAVSGKLRVGFSRGEVEASFGSPFDIPPVYAFKLGIHDPVVKRLLAVDTIQPYLRILSEGGEDITQKLRIQKFSDSLLLVGNIAPGIPGSPLRLRVVWETPLRSFKVQEGTSWREGKIEPQFETLLAPPLRAEGVVEVFFPENSAWEFGRWKYDPRYYELRLPDNASPQADFVFSTDEMHYFRNTIFDASPSKDPDGVIVDYWWWSQKPVFPDTHAKKFTHAFSSPEVISVTLQVTDDRGETARKTSEVAVDATRTIGGRSVTMPPAFVRSKEVKYEVEVLTGDYEGAGTDAHVFLALYEKPEREGVVYGSGVMELASPLNLFERGEKNLFWVRGREITTLDHMALLHDNSGSRPGWYVVGLKVKDTSSGKEWVFLPDRWLALDEADHKTYGEFQPLSSVYPAGIVVEGDRNSYNLIELSEDVFVLPQGTQKFYFTCGDGSKRMEVYRENGTLVGNQEPSGKKRIAPYLTRNEWGVEFSASSLTRPERFAVKTQSGNSLTEKWVWVFPPVWSDYRQAALQASILYQLKGKTDVFLCAQKVQTYLAGLKPNVIAATLPAIDYGVSSLSIFGPSPRSLLIRALSTNLSNYLANQKIVISQLSGGASSGLISNVFSLLTSLYRATEWALKLPQVLGSSVSEVYKIVLLEYLGKNDLTLQQIDLLLQKAKELVETVIKAFEANNPSSCALALRQLRTLVVGNNPSSTNLSGHQISYANLGVEDKNPLPADYPLAILISSEMMGLQNWRQNGHPAYEMEENRKWLNLIPYNKVEATNRALDVFEPLFEVITQVAGLLVNVCLLEIK